MSWAFLPFCGSLGFPIPRSEHSPGLTARWLDYIAWALPYPLMLESKIAFPSIFVKMAM